VRITSVGWQVTLCDHERIRGLLTYMRFLNLILKQENYNDNVQTVDVCELQSTI